MSLTITTALRKITELKKKLRVVRGGQGSGKTISILTLLCNHASSVPNREILILSEELTKMRLTVIKDFVKVMRMLGIYNESNFVAGTLYRFPNGSFVKFIGLDKEDVGKGLRSDIAYFNEVNKCSKESYRQVASRTKIMICDYNPDAKFYIDTDVIPREDCDFLQLTFMDNEALPESEREEILNYHLFGYGVPFDFENPQEEHDIINAYYANLWQVYGLGNIGSLQGVVFSNWSEIDGIPEDYKLDAYGLDWGFSADPTALTAIWKNGESFIYEEIIYETDLTNSDIISRLKELGVSKSIRIFADSSEPKSITDLKRAGFKVVPAYKPNGSIKYGIDKMQQNPFFVTSNSKNLISEFQSYKWAVDRFDNQTGKPIDKHNHAIDGIRYYHTERDKYKANYV